MHAYLTGKTPLCGETRAGEPLRCAKVNPHTPVDPLGFGEPYNYHIVNRYFDEFLLKAVVLANASRGTDMYVRCSVASLYTLLYINIYTPWSICMCTNLCVGADDVRHCHYPKYTSAKALPTHDAVVAALALL